MMPYYAWRGVDILGEDKTGKMYARSPEYLDSVLFGREIALLHYQPISWRWRYRAVSQELKIEFFKQLAVLLEGGVALPQALLVVAEQLHHPGMQEIIHEIADLVDHGNAFSSALSKYANAFDPISIQLAKAGEEAGSLGSALTAIAERLEMRQEFSRALKNALILPSLTFAFFLAITLFLFTFIVPRFAELFASMHQELPSSTMFMMQISNYVRSWHFVVAAALMSLFGYALFIFGKTKQGKEIKDQFILKVPFVNTIMWYRFIAYFLASLAMLLKRGLQLVPALHTIALSMNNVVFKEYVQTLEEMVRNGRSLTVALQDMGSYQFPLELIALVHVGENSGTLEVLLEKAAIRYQNQVKRLLSRFTALIQPTLMIVLGLLVLLLIFAIYLPIIQLSNMA